MAGLAHADRVLEVLNSAEAARSAVAASWRRCLTLHHLDPEADTPPQTLTEAELRLAYEAVEPLARAAEAPLDRLFQAVGDAGCCVLLTDRHGVPVARRGSGVDDDTFRRWGLWVGAVWSEAAAGTNGIGACLAENRPLTIHRDQHFHTRNIGLSCTATPVYDHLGQLAGALDVSSRRADLAEGMIPLVAAAGLDAARRIESQVFRQAFPKARILLVEDAALDRPSSPLLAVDADDRVVGATRAARLSLKITEETLRRGLPAADLLGPGEAPGAPALLAAERSAVQRALARAGGNVSAAADDLGVSRATLHRKISRLGLARSH
jgi:transcriptional regulator of acetoin/glycerol metabolism